jgi:hypothetical protein
VLDQWLIKIVRPLVKTEIFLLRYADDFIIRFEYQVDALRLIRTLAKRMAKCGLIIHPEKSKLIKFSPVAGPKPPIFVFLGFTHYCTKNHRVSWIVKHKSCKKKMRVIVKKT